MWRYSHHHCELKSPTLFAPRADIDKKLQDMRSQLLIPYAASAGVSLVIVKTFLAWTAKLSNEEQGGIYTSYEYWISAAFLALLLKSVWTYVGHVSQMKFPGPVPLPLVGTALSLVDKDNMQESIRSLFDTYGNVVDMLFLDGERIVLVNDAAFCKTAMKSMDRGDVKHFEQNSKPTILPRFFWKTGRFREKLVWQELWGDVDLDLFTRSDKFSNWKAHRRLLQPAFDQKHVRAMSRKIDAVVTNLVNRIPSDGSTVDALPLLQEYGLEMIHSTALGKSLSDLPDRGRFIVQYLSYSMKLWEKYLFDPFPYLSSQILPHLGLNALELQRREELPKFRQYCRDLILKEQKRQAQQQKNSTQDDDDGGVDNLLSLMVAKLNDSFQVENAVDELISFLFAGYDTTSVTLGNLLYDLATHPEAQKKVHDELDQHFQAYAKNGTETLSHASQDLPYLSACIRESQRLQPVAPILKRRLHQDVPVQSYKEDGRDSNTKKTQTAFVPKGNVVFVPAFLLQRDETQYAPDPDAFRPERWLRTDNGDRDDNDNGALLIPTTPGYFYAFGAGPKMCVGFQLAEKEVKMAAAGIFKAYSVTSKGTPKIVDSFTTGPDKVLVEFRKRD